MKRIIVGLLMCFALMGCNGKDNNEAVRVAFKSVYDDCKGTTISNLSTSPFGLKIEVVCTETVEQRKK